jgi:hypothetical protein
MIKNVAIVILAVVAIVAVFTAKQSVDKKQAEYDKNKALYEKRISVYKQQLEYSERRRIDLIYRLNGLHNHYKGLLRLDSVKIAEQHAIIGSFDNLTNLALQKKMIDEYKKR